MLNFKELPKIDLHCHLDGSLPIQIMEKHLGRTIHTNEVSVGRDCHSLTDYLKKFDIPVQCLQTSEHLENSSYAFIEQLPSDNVQYIEVRFAPMLSVHDGITCSQVIESVLKGLEKGRQKTGISYQVITCAMRHFPYETNMELLNAAEKFLNKGVCAIDLAGDESHYPNSEFCEFFQEVSHRKIPFTIHSGETGNVENIKYALEFGASRIGHGLALIQNKDLMQEIASKALGIEMCPTSNLQTKAVSSLNEYPLLQFLDTGIKASINTDNRTVSCTDITKEFNLLWDLYHDEAVILQVHKNAKETAFCRF